MQTRGLMIVACAFLVACATPAQPNPSPPASPEPTVVAAPGREPVTDAQPEVPIRLPVLDTDNVLDISYSDQDGPLRYMAPDQYPAAVELLQVLSQAQATGKVPLETKHVAVLGIGLRDRTGFSLYYFGGNEATVHSVGQAAALEIPGLAAAMQKMAALPPEISLDPAVASLPEPIVLLTGREAEAYRSTRDSISVRDLPDLPDFSVAQHGALSPDGRRVAFTFGISDGTGLWVMDMDSGRYRHLRLFYGTRAFYWRTSDRLIFEWDHGVGCVAFDADPPLIRSLDLPGEDPWVFEVESPWLTYRTGRGAETVIQKIRIDGPGGC